MTEERVLAVSRAHLHETKLKLEQAEVPLELFRKIVGLIVDEDATQGRLLCVVSCLRSSYAASEELESNYSRV